MVDPSTAFALLSVVMVGLIGATVSAVIVLALCCLIGRLAHRHRRS